MTKGFVRIFVDETVLRVRVEKIGIESKYNTTLDIFR